MHGERRIIKIIEHSIHSRFFIEGKNFFAENTGIDLCKELEESALMIGPSKLETNDQSQHAADKQEKHAEEQELLGDHFMIGREKILADEAQFVMTMSSMSVLRSFLDLGW